MSAAGALGAGLIALGAGMNERRKELLLERLEKEREQRAADREKAKEQRQEEAADAVVTKEELIKDGGLYYTERRNRKGKVLGRETANPLSVERYNTEAQKDRVGIDQILANTDSARATADQTRTETKWLPEKYGLERRLTEAQIRNYDEPNHAPSKDDGPTDHSLPSLTNYLMSQFSDLREQYTEGEDATMTAEDFRKIAEEVIKNAAARGQDARIIFPDALRRFGKPRIKGK